jgi:aldose 1-epimerase
MSSGNSSTLGTAVAPRDGVDIVRLHHLESAVSLCPETGGAIVSYTWRGMPILRSAPESALRDRNVRQMACYPLVPYSNRIGHADLLCGAQRHQLRANSPPEPHALHGFGWQREWQLVSHTDDSATLVLRHAPDIDWPFACEAEQIVRLDDDGLHVRLTVRNRDAQSMPAGLGLHPYFPLEADTRLQANWSGMWSMTVDHLPSEHIAVPAEADFRLARNVSEWRVDHCFTGWNRRAVLEYATHRVQLDASADCSRIVCYAPRDGRHFIALEPVSHVNNAFALAGRGVRDTGMRMLVPGESMEISMSIAVSARSGMG